MQNTVSTPKEFFEIIVNPDVQDFFADQSSIRKAFHACMSLDHLRDRVAKFIGEYSGSYSDKLYAECAAIREIRDISVNAKHFPPDPNRSVIIHVGVTAKSITLDEVTVSIDDMLGSIDSYGTAPQLIAKTISDQDRWLTLVINEAYVFWKNKYEKDFR